MKKLLFVLACAASLGLWISCNNGAQELDVTLHGGMDDKTYTNVGTVTAKKITMVTRKAGKVLRDSNDNIVKPTDGKDYYRGWEYDKTEGEDVEYWFYNEWDAGTDVTFDSASVSWSNNVGVWSEGFTTGHENVSNAKYYDFNFKLINDDGKLDHWFSIQKSGDVYQFGNDNAYEYGTAELSVSGDLEGNFEIATLKKLDSKYTDYKRMRLDKWTYDEVTEEYKPYTGVYYLTNVKFTKN